MKLYDFEEFEDTIDFIVHLLFAITLFVTSPIWFPVVFAWKITKHLRKEK